MGWDRMECHWDGTLLERIQGILSFLLFPDTFGKGWKVIGLESWKVGRLECCKVKG